MFFYVLVAGRLPNSRKLINFLTMDPYTGNSASASGPKKDKKSKKNYEDGDGKKKFVSIDVFKLVAV